MFDKINNDSNDDLTTEEVTRLLEGLEGPQWHRAMHRHLTGRMPGAGEPVEVEMIPREPQYVEGWFAVKLAMVAVTLAGLLLYAASLTYP